MEIKFLIYKKTRSTVFKMSIAGESPEKYFYGFLISLYAKIA